MNGPIHLEQLEGAWRQVSALILEYHLPISFQGWLSCALISLAIEVKHRC